MALYQIYSSNKLHRVMVDSVGCKICELVLNNIPIFWSGVRPDGKWAATHPCLPNFGKVTTGNLSQLPQHGPARHEKWEATTNIGMYEDMNIRKAQENKELEASKAEFKWTMTAVEGIYPGGLVATRTISISDEGIFTLAMVLENTGSQPLPINPGEHSYFQCPEKLRNQFKLNGSGVDTENWEKTEFRAIGNQNFLDIPSIGKLMLEVNGYDCVALWALPGANFICCEPNWGKPDSINEPSHVLYPGEEKGFKMRLAIR